MLCSYDDLTVDITLFLQPYAMLVYCIVVAVLCHTCAELVDDFIYLLKRAETRLMEFLSSLLISAISAYLCQRGYVLPGVCC